MSSTPIYDELAATYLADLIPAPGEPTGSGEPAVPAVPAVPEQPGEQEVAATAPESATPAPDRPRPRARPKV
ncbi:hypothetical protein IOD16_09130 [Saccharothrix sp. 6-C]|uniref:hypothetical protein n=1 Tax=Saccharothrix sp. 6-C TaxID=2781735 RepID=UPI001916D037|nr:hypothetical protein [Saccharothrix sp. 6-C]QQQ78593.1 hypothetical protein IOD16_09130 [Saccharothrix sp. 6-C]